MSGVPDFQTLMRPLLALASDGQEHTMAEAISKLADEFNLTEDQRAESLPGGGQRRFHNRVYWAKTHLRAAGLVTSPTRGRFVITPDGLASLEEHPVKIDMKALGKYPGYSAFVSGSGSTAPAPGAAATATPQTPEEVIGAAMAKVDADLAEEILERVRNNPPSFLEGLVVRLLRAMEYGGADDEAAVVVGGPGDEGVDGIIKLDRLGLDIVYLQAKRWKDPVAPRDIRDFVGSLKIKSASRGVFITTSTFSPDARDAASKSGMQVVLIDGARLGRLMIEYNVGVTAAQSFTIKRLDSDFFDNAG